MIVTFRVIFLTYFVVTLPYICFVSISVDGTYWSAIVFNKDQLTHPACVQYMGGNQQSTLGLSSARGLLSFWNAGGWFLNVENQPSHKEREKSYVKLIQL